MLVLERGATRTCDGVSRRDWLRVGGLGTFGLSLADLAGRPAVARAAEESPGFGRAKSCIVLFMFGAPAHQDTFDLKLDAPQGIRGEFGPIDTAVPGLTVCEHLPQLAARLDQLTQIRSVTHPDNTHTVAMHYMLSGVRHKRPATNPQNAADDFPCFGSGVRYASQQQRRGAGDLPAAVSLNAPANQVSANNHIFPGFFAGMIGNGYDPLFVSQNANAVPFQPFPALDDALRLSARRSLLGEFDQASRRVESTAAVGRLRTEYAQAFDLLTSSGTRRAFTLDAEPAEMRARYGATPFGQGCLLARRLVEAGVRLVTVNWERDDAYWDTHADNFGLMKKSLLPNLDRGFSALLDDLRERGLLDETLIVWLGEFGRTPKINANAGRDHWAPCATVLLAGAGLPGGMVYGASDATAAYPTSHPVTPEDLAATIYHLLGIPPEMRIFDGQGRPHHLSTGDPVWDLLS